MGRYAYNGYEELINPETGELKGINFGYGFYAEHERGFSCVEQTKPPLKFGKKNKAFEEERIKQPGCIQLIKLDEQHSVLTNSPYLTEDFQAEDLKQSRDVEEVAKMSKQFGMQIGQPNPFYTSWTDKYFTILSIDSESAQILEHLYQEIMRGNVAVSSNFSSSFKDRGLSFVMLDQLEKANYKKSRGK